jgi:acetate---CoA ligase (ADP-forming)
MNRARVERLLAPRSIAFVGGRALTEAIRNAEELGFDGELWVVNPQYDELAGHHCYPTVDDLPAPPDAAFVGVGRDRAIEVIRALAVRGTGGAVCLAAGFAEIGDTAAQRSLVTAAGDMPVMGPNCYGLLNLVDGVALWPDLHGAARIDAGAALVAQSGNITLNATMSDRSVPLTHVLSIGNQAVTGFGSYLDVLIDDPRVHAVGLYVEGITDVPILEAAAERALRRGVPVIALRSGASDDSARVIAHHTGSARDDEDEALFDRVGIVEVGTPAALLEALKLATTWRETGAGTRLAAVAASGGDLALFADRAVVAGLTFPPLDDATSTRLGEELGPLVSVANPLDYHTGIWGRAEELVSCFCTVMAEDIDAAVLVLDLPRPGTGDPGAWWVTMEAFITAHERTGRAAAVVSTLPEGLPAAARDRLLASGVAPLQGLEEAVAALAAVAKHHRRRQALGPNVSGAEGSGAHGGGADAGG